jgi:GlpG protein
LAGQIWRLVTPIFIHFGLMHLVFNMIWLWDIGLPTERRNGHLFMLCFVLLVGVSANLAQYLLTGYPFFGGMSGVVYGLFGYLWMQGKYNPNFGIALHNRTIAIMLGWFVLCWFGLLGPVANWAHSFGLGVGIAWGYLDAARARSTSRDRTIEQQGS